MLSANYGGPKGEVVRSNGSVKAESPKPDPRQVTGSGSGARRRERRVCGQLRGWSLGLRLGRRYSPGSEERDAMCRSPSSALFGRGCRVVAHLSVPEALLATSLGFPRLARKRGLFGMAVTLQELSRKDSDPHGFLTIKGKGEWKYARWTCLLSACIHLASVYWPGAVLAVREITVNKVDAITCPRGAFALTGETDKQNYHTGFGYIKKVKEN